MSNYFMPIGKSQGDRSSSSSCNDTVHLQLRFIFDTAYDLKFIFLLSYVFANITHGRQFEKRVLILNYFYNLWLK